MGVAHYENFPVASILLPRRLRRPVLAIYAFAREADDIADEGEASARQRLADLDHRCTDLDRIEQGLAPTLSHCLPLAAAVREHALPVPLLRDLLDAFRQDVTRTRYANYDELLDYCRRSAHPIGRLLLHLYGRTDEPSLVRSDLICSSLQIVNFLQDVAIDYRKGRIYLPLDEMRQHAVSETMIANGDANPQWRAFMLFQIDRARERMSAGAPLAADLRGRIGMELRLVIAGGRRILDKLAAVEGDVFRHRPVLGRSDWVRMFLSAAVRA